MNPRLAAIVIIPVLLHLNLRVTAGGLAVTIPGAALLAAALAVSAVVLTWLIVRSLHHRTVVNWST